MVRSHAPVIIVDPELDNEYDYSIQLNRWFMRPLGVWPMSATSTVYEKAFSTILIVTCYCLLSSTVVPCILYMMLEDTDIRIKLKSVGPLSHYFMAVVNYTWLLVNRNEIRRCLGYMEADWRTVNRGKDHDTMLRNAKFGRFVALFCAAFMQGGSLSFTVFTVTTTEIIRIGNASVAVRLLPCPPYTDLIDRNASPTYEIVLISQFLSCFIANSVYVGGCSLASVLALHACGQLSILLTRIIEFVDETKESQLSRKKELGILVEHHLRVLRFISSIEDATNQINFTELFRCTMSMCLLGYRSATEWDDGDAKSLMTYFIIFIAVCSNLFIICYIGEVLMEQCKSVGETVYMTDWYNLHHKTILDLILIISRSGSAIKITAGKIIQMSITTFADVMKTSVAYLNLLRTLT